MEQISLIAPDISCDHCKRAIEGAVSAIDGVDMVAVDVPSRRVDVTLDPARTSRAAVAAAMEEEGYPVAE